jgi:hypothetical protein
MTTLTLDIISAFGEYHFDRLHKNKSDFIKCVTYDNPIDRFTILCESILKNKCDNVNQFEFDNLLRKLMEDTPEEVNEIIFNLINNITCEFKQWLDKMIIQNDFSVDYFKEAYNKFYHVKKNFAKQLRYFENCVIKIKPHSHVMLMANYAFYKNVIDQTYTYNNVQISLHKLFSISLNDSLSIDKILPIFHMFKYYDKLSYAVGKKREQLFNITEHTNFLSGLGTNINLVKSLINVINENYEQIVNDDKNIQNKVDEIKDIINMGIQFEEREMFIHYYMKSLENRLLKITSNLNVEMDAIKIFSKNKDDNRIVQKMNNMITDIEDCRKHKMFIERLKVRFSETTCDKFKKIGLSLDTFDKTKALILPLSFGTWEATINENIGKFNVPDVLQPYLDIFNGYYNKRYAYRNLTYDFTRGKAIISVVLGGIKYTIEVTTPQLFMLHQFNVAPRISAINLAQNLGMTLKELTPVLNSLLKCSLVDREMGNKTDPNLKFFLNTKFTNPQTEFSILPFMNNNKIDQEAVEKLAHKREEILKCKIVNILKHSEKLIVEELFEKCTNEISLFGVTPDMFKYSLTAAIKEEFVIQMIENENKYYMFVLKSDSNDDTEDENDESDD